MNGDSLPSILTEIPGPCSQKWIDRLAERECPAITARRARRAQNMGVSDADPIVWKQAKGANVQDVDGNIFVDLTAGFGVAGAGHAAEDVVQAGKDQLDKLIHAMGDAFPDPRRIELMERLCALSGMDRAILGSSGSDAVEAALKTAQLASGRKKVLAFSNSYHGLSFGALPATDYKSEHFRKPFAHLLREHVSHHSFGKKLPSDLSEFGAILVEPIQGRGGIQMPPSGWLDELIHRAHREEILVIFDEIYTGFGRTGTWFGFQNPEICSLKPDLICVGKALGGGFPISACLGTAAAMDAWGASRGEAIHTQTFLGNPLGCAMAMASLKRIEELIPKVKSKGDLLRKDLENKGFNVRGTGLIIGIEIEDSMAKCRELLRRGYIILPAGSKAEVLALTPPLSIEMKQLLAFSTTLAEICLK